MKLKHKLNKRILLIFLLGLFLVTDCIAIRKSFANPVTIGGDTIELGGLLPSNETSSIQMQTADVLMIIDATSHPDYFEAEFSGNYTFYNSNETIELVVGAPFMIEDSSYQDTSYISQVIASLEIKVNELEVTHSFEYLNDITGWEEYLADFEFYWIFALANVTFEANSTTNISYFWKTNQSIGSYSNYLEYFYDVGTGRIWEGNITETVTMKVLGKEPTYYTDYKYGVLSRNCSIEEFNDGANYSWYWIDERITDYYVGISYTFKQRGFNQDWIITRNIIISVSTAVLVSIVVLVTIKLVKRKRKRKRKRLIM